MTDVLIIHGEILYSNIKYLGRFETAPERRIVKTYHNPASVFIISVGVRGGKHFGNISGFFIEGLMY